MATKVYVGNLSWNTTDDTLKKAFSNFGQVLDSIVMRDRETGRSRGFGFVTYSSEEEAQVAIANLNEQDFEGRRIKVNFANARPGGGGAGAGGGVGGGVGGGYQAGGGFGGGGGGFSGYPQQGGGGYGGSIGAEGYTGGYGGGGYQGGQGGYQGGAPGGYGGAGYQGGY